MESSKPLSSRNMPRLNQAPSPSPSQAEEGPLLEGHLGAPETIKTNFQLVLGSLVLESEFNSQVYRIRSDLLSRTSISEVVRAVVHYLFRS